MQMVEWVLVVRYGKSAHRATYGRLDGGTYTKDYIQLYRNPEFLNDLESAFPALQAGDGVTQITYKWPSGSANGKLVRKSADRPHLAWDTNSAPRPWKMHEQPTATSVESIRGNPSFKDSATADFEHDRLLTSGFGQPFLIAVKLQGEMDTLHLRVLIENPDEFFAWEDLKNAPTQIKNLAATTSQSKALAWQLFSVGETSNIYFDPNIKSQPWGDIPTTLIRNTPDDLGIHAGPPDRGASEAPTSGSAEEWLSFAATLALELPTDIDFSAVLVEPPIPKTKAWTRVDEKPSGPKKVDHEQRAQINNAVGKLGEDFALAYERWRLREHPELLQKLRHVSKEDDTLGYDIESFELDGSARLVEVKGTLGPMESRFFLSAAELSCAETKGERYVVLRVARLANNPKCCEIRYPFVGKLELTPATYSVGFAAELM